MRTIRNASFLLLLAVLVVEKQEVVKASFSCPSECWYHEWAVGWFCDCYTIEDCTINYPNFCQDFFLACPGGTCSSTGNCAAYCQEGQCC